MSETRRQIAGEVRRVLATIAGDDVVASVDDEDLLFQQDVVDSLHLVELITALEDRFGFGVASDELSPDNFESISAMTGYIERKRG